MARKNKLKKTKYSNIYEVEMNTAEIHYIAKFIHKGTRYPEKNLTEKYGVNTAKQAFDKLNEIRIELSRGNNVFAEGTSKIDDLVKKYLNTRSEDYRKNCLAHYNAHIRTTIGHLYIDKVTKQHLESIKRQMEEKGLATSTIKKAKVLLSPIFKTAYQDEVTNRNILDNFTFGSDRAKLPLSERLNESLLDGIRKIYKTALNEPDDYASLFLTSIMCARRLGEITEIEFRDIKDGVVNVRAITTKTYKKKIQEGKCHEESIVERYPLPQEVLNRITQESENPKEKVFKHYKRTYMDKYKDFIDLRCKLDLTESGKEVPIRSHDNRNFIMSIQGRESGIDNVGMICLSHSDISNMNQRYASIELDEIKEIYNSYWKKLRN